MLSILIPTWNNLPYLKLCIEKIRQHSGFDHQILVHVNQGSDGTLEWIKQQGITYSHSSSNIGICLAVNQLASMATNDWLVYLNDDMVCCPGWDDALIRSIKALPNDLAYLSPTLIEPIKTVNRLTIVQNFGETVENFDELRLLAEYRADQRGDVAGQASPVAVVSRRWWHMVGGYSIELSPGMASEDDLMMKFWIAGCRHYAVIGDSRIYHFARRSTGRVRRNRGARTFVTKWGLTLGEFKRHYLMRSATPEGKNIGIPAPTLLGRFKRVVYGIAGDFPLGDISRWEMFPGRYVTTEKS